MTREELIAALEKAEGPSRELDCEIAMHRMPELRGFARIGEDWVHPQYSTIRTYAIEYTASIDAALTLVPEGWDWSVVLAERFEDKNPASCQVIQRGRLKFHTTHAATPALALCIAALKARA